MLIEKIERKPDIFICTETWKIESINLYKIDGYDIYYSEGKVNIADGVIVYVKTEICKKVNIKQIDKLNVIEIEIKDVNNNNYLITAIYKLHCIEISDFLEALENYLIVNKKSNRQIIIGDININIKACKQEVIDYCTLLAENEFISTINSVTRPNKNGGTCIDHIFVKGIDNYKSYSIQHMISDHFMTGIIINQDIKCVVEKEKFKKMNIEKIKQKCKKIKWNDILELRDVNQATENLIDIIKKVKNESLKTKNIRKKNPIRKEWITKAIAKSCDYKNFLYKTRKKSRRCK